MNHFVICNTCAEEKADYAEINYGKVRAPTNVKNHLHAYHKDTYDAFLLKKVHAKKPLMNSISLFYKPTKVSESMDHLLKFIVNKHLPIATVEDKDFRNFAKSLCPSYEISIKRST